MERGAYVVPEQKSSKKHYYIIAALIAAVLIALALRSGGDNSGAADGVRSQIEQAGRNQQTITDGIADAEKGVGGITTSIDRSAEAIGRADSADCREILGSIRENAGKKDAE